jgi:hypothetical protein
MVSSAVATEPHDGLVFHAATGAPHAQHFEGAPLPADHARTSCAGRRHLCRGTLTGTTTVPTCPLRQGLCQGTSATPSPRQGAPSGRCARNSRSRAVALTSRPPCSSLPHRTGRGSSSGKWADPMRTTWPSRSSLWLKGGTTDRQSPRTPELLARQIRRLGEWIDSLAGR